MEIITFISELDATEWIQIPLSDGGFTSMLKEVYDAQQAAQLNGINPPPITE
jgi:hypothetical protein